MNKLLGQLRFDGKRMVWRNPGFMFMTIMMPTCFYVLFTKIIPSPLDHFDATYMGSMLVYSSLITAIMGSAAFLMRDHIQGLTTFLQLSNRHLTYYYESVIIWNTIKNILALVVLGITAVVINQVTMNWNQWLGIIGWLIVGQLPLLAIGIALSFVKRQEVLNMLSNFITFPLAIISGLWWPIQVFPKWIQEIGQHLPTYYLNDAIGQMAQDSKIKWGDLWGILIWSVILLGVVLIIYRNRQQGTVDRANEI